MRFGSVEFFKVLIKVVLAILFFVPLILAVVFGVLFVQKNTKVDELTEQNSIVQQDNNRLSVVADVLVGEKVAGAQDIREILKLSGTSYEDFLKLAMEKKDIDAQGLYDILSKSGVSDKDIVTIAASKKTVDAEDFYDVMSKNGITAQDLIKAVINSSGSDVDDFYDILSQCGMNDEELIEYIQSKSGTSQPTSEQSGEQSSEQTSAPETSESDVSDSAPAQSETSSAPEEESPYAELYPDMYVSAPENYSYDEGTVYFTFDDGPSQYTYGFLDYLRKYNAKATWFVVPSRDEWCTEALKTIAAEGHTIGIHSATHDYNKIYASVEAFLEDFHEAWSIVRDATGQTPQIFRFPGGSQNDYNESTRDAIIKEMTRRGFRFYDWNVESGDVDGATWQQMYNSIPRDCHGVKRPVILMHDSAGTQNALYVIEDVLKVLQGEGYKFDAIRNDTEPVQFIGPFS